MSNDQAYKLLEIVVDEWKTANGAAPGQAGTKEETRSPPRHQDTK